MWALGCLTPSWYMHVWQRYPYINAFSLACSHLDARKQSVHLFITLMFSQLSRLVGKTGLAIFQWG